MQIGLDQNYLRVVDGALDRDFCQLLIRLFEQDHRYHRRRDDRAQLTELELTSDHHFNDLQGLDRARLHNKLNWQLQTQHIESVIRHLTPDYLAHWAPGDYMPPRYTIEGQRIKRYIPGEKFGPHIDVSRSEHSTRFLSFLFYLNDSDGGTRFTDHTVDAVEGRVVLFPPLWPWPHEGLSPKEGPKYILSTYLNMI
jgi:hypothetical protein